MGIESLLVDALVAASLVYAAWTLMPQIVRRTLATGLLRLPLPTRVSAFLAQAAQDVGSCDCSGCERSLAKGVHQRKPAALTAKPVVFHPRQHLNQIAHWHVE